MQQLRELVLQLKVDNKRLRQERAASPRASGGATLPVLPSQSSSAGPTPTVTERLVVVPRDRKCPVFSGKSGIGIRDWVEEVQACVRARPFSVADQALFIFDHLAGEAREENKLRSTAERGDPGRILAILQELYGCVQPHVVLQQAFFSWHMLKGETLHEFSLALLALMAQVKECAPDGMPNADVLLRDQFMEHVSDGALQRELKQFVRHNPTTTLLELRGETMRWEREGLPGAARVRSASLPAVYRLQYGVQGHTRPFPNVASPGPGLSDLMELLKCQQEQLDQMTYPLCKPRVLGVRFLVVPRSSADDANSLDILPASVMPSGFSLGADPIQCLLWTPTRLGGSVQSRKTEAH